MTPKDVPITTAPSATTVLDGADAPSRPSKPALELRADRFPGRGLELDYDRRHRLPVRLAQLRVLDRNVPKPQVVPALGIRTDATGKRQEGEKDDPDGQDAKRHAVPVFYASPMSRATNVRVALVALIATSLAVLHAQDPSTSLRAGARYRDPTVPVDARVADLLGRMTLEEKVAQLLGIWGQKVKIQDEAGRFVPAKAKALIGDGIGQISRPSEIAGPSAGRPVRQPREHAEFVNAVQKWVIDNTRLGIPVMFHEEALHGLAAPRGTHFPVPIGLASTWDPALVERLMSVAAREARARGCQHVLSPVVDLGRDPRWGRIEETYGEDPHLVSRLGVAAVRGYQGTSLPLAKDKVFATLKHFAGHGSHEGGINTAPPLVSERLMRAELLVPFEVAVKEAGVYAVMPSYNEVDGVAMHANRWLLEDVLRREWGFQGIVVSDYFAIEQLISRHRVAADKAEAARQSLDAGVDIELPDPDGFPELVAMVKDGRVSQASVDLAAGRMLKAKFLAGLFENPYVDPAEAERVTNTAEHQALALEAARKSIVLLKNDRELLPLDRAKAEDARRHRSEREGRPSWRLLARSRTRGLSADRHHRESGPRRQGRPRRGRPHHGARSELDGRQGGDG